MPTEQRRKWMRDYIKKYRLKNKEKLSKQYLEYLHKAKEDAIRYYSNGTMKCAQCEYNNIICLEFDHINNDGAKHRKEMKKRVSFGVWAKANNYPPGFQVLCRNCNWIKEIKRRRVNS